MNCIITCEHASNRVPSRFSRLFTGQDNLLASHRAYDPGTAEMARRLAAKLQVPVYLGNISRLLIDLNRSLTNRRSLFTAYSRKLQTGERSVLIEKYYAVYRETVEKEIGLIIEDGKPVLHISIHSFASVKNGKTRKADVGLLYDPARTSEKKICHFLMEFLQKNVKSLRVRRNYPYRGKTDGFTSFLRKKYPDELYAGIEIEMNQALLPTGPDKKKQETRELLCDGIRGILKSDYFTLTGKYHEDEK